MTHLLSKTIHINKSFAILAGAAFCFMLTSPYAAKAQDAETVATEVIVSEDIDVVAPDVTDLDAPAETVADIDRAPEAVAVPHSGTYYDSSSFGTSAVGRTAPREVDPKYEPGSRYVVVRQNSTAGSFSAQLVSAQRALKLGRYTSALEIYEQLYKKNSKNTRVLMGLAVAQQNSGFIESAMATYEELLRIEPNNTDATVNMIGLVSAQNPEQAYNRLSQMWQKNNRNPAIAAQLGLASAELGDFESAIRYLGVASSIEPTNPNHYYNMAVVSDRAGMVKQAIDFYQKSLEMDAASGSRIVSRDVVYDRLSALRSL